MANKFFASCLLIAGMFNHSAAQDPDLYIPLEIKKAYELGTRSPDGNPGPNYWQNSIDYKIKVSIDPIEKMIEGSLEAIYYNFSPDVLTVLTVRLYGDIYKKGNQRSSRISIPNLNNGVEVYDIKLDGIEFTGGNQGRVPRSGTNMWVGLKEPLNPGESIKFQCSWKQQIPKLNNFDQRSGYFDSSNFFLSLWYPQISVYDDLFGWDNLNYTFVTEFYNNLANYDVEITVPEGYLVWATGALTNAGEVLPEEIEDRVREAGTSREVIKIITPENLKDAYKTRESTWNYIAEAVSDFVFAIGKDYLWEATSQVVANKNVLINVVFPDDKDADYSKVAEYLQKSMKYFSEDIPGIPYPYEAYTVFIGNTPGGGMEYPMMANNGGPDMETTVHELFHTYFPMYVRTNERKWVWMDEGWADHTTHLVLERYFDDEPDFKHIFSGSINEMISQTGTMSELPLMGSAEHYSNFNEFYYSMVLSSTAISVLQQHLGEELFLKCYREYIRRWARKSPTPYDLFFTFENVSGQDLAWIWKPWFFESGVPDLSIVSFESGKLLIENKGIKPVPVLLEIEYSDGKKNSLSRSAKIWAGRITSTEIFVDKYERIKSIVLNQKVPDVNMTDNFYPSLRERYHDVSPLPGITGIYTNPYGDFELVLNEGILLVKNERWDPGTVLTPYDDDTYYTLDSSLRYDFQKDDSGIVTGVKLNYELYGFEIESKKFD